MVIVLKHNVLYAANKDMWQETKDVLYYEYTNHQMATENQNMMYINKLRLEEVDQ